MSKQRNARFWVYVNGMPVKVTLRPGESYTHTQGGPTDEGWYRNSDTWEHVGDGIVRSWERDGRDCDGRLTRGGEDYAGLDQLAVVEPYYTDSERPTWEGVLWPDWQPLQSRQYDEYAEAMGY